MVGRGRAQAKVAKLCEEGEESDIMAEETPYCFFSLCLRGAKAIVG